MAVGLTVSTRERERERESAPSSAVPATAEDSETGREMADPLCPRSRRGMAVGHTSSETAALTLCVWRPSGHPAPSSTARPGPGVLSLTYVAAHRAFQQRPEIRNVHHGAGGSAPPLGPYQAGSFAGHAVCAPQRGARPRLDSIPPRRISAPQLSLQVPVQHRAPTLTRRRPSSSCFGRAPPRPLQQCRGHLLPTFAPTNPSGYQRPRDIAFTSVDWTLLPSPSLSSSLSSCHAAGGGGGGDTGRRRTRFSRFIGVHWDSCLPHRARSCGRPTIGILLASFHSSDDTGGAVHHRRWTRHHTGTHEPRLTTRWISFTSSSVSVAIYIFDMPPLV